MGSEWEMVGIELGWQKGVKWQKNFRVALLEFLRQSDQTKTMKLTEFRKILGGLDALTKAQAKKLYNELKGRHWNNLSGTWWDSDSPTTEFRAMTSFA